MRGLKSVVSGLGRNIKVLSDEIDDSLVVHQRGTDWYVSPQDGPADDNRSASDNGKSWAHPFETMAEAFSRMSSGDRVHFIGNITEELTPSNLLEDISVIGHANRPRHADHARDHLTYAYGSFAGASWRQAASHGATTPLLTLRAQGWHLENFLMVPPSDAAAIYNERNAFEHLTTEYDASHLAVVGMRFAGGLLGIGAGEAYGVLVKDCTFHDMTTGIGAGGLFGVSVLTAWVIDGCRFFNNTNHIKLQAKWFDVKHNTFGKFTTLSVDLKNGGTDGAGNTVHGNHFFGVYAHPQYQEAAADDAWGGNSNVIAGGWTAALPA